MSDMLDDIPNEELRKRLQDYSEEPDEGRWSKIASGVREQMPLGTRLQTYQEEPDAFVWAKVSQGLSVESRMMWLERAGKMATVVAYLLLLFPLIETQKESPYVDNVVVIKEAPAAVSMAFGDSIGGISENNEHQPELDSSNAERHNSIIRKDNVQDGKTKRSSGNHSIASKQIQNESENIFDGDRSGVNRMDLTNISDKNTTGNAIIASDSGNVSREEAFSGSRSQLVKNPITNPVESELKSDSVELIQPGVVTSTVRDSVKDNKPEEQKKSKKKKHYDLYALIMPTFGYQQISPVKDDNLIIESIERISTFSTKRLGIRAEVGIEKEFYHKFSYHVGLLYFQRKQSIQYHFRDTREIAIQRIDPKPLTYQVSSMQDTATFSYELKNIGLVIGLNYTTKMGRFIHKVGFASEFQKGLSTVDPKIDNGQRYYIFGDVYYRLSYPVSARIEVIFQPTINYALQIDERINAPFYVKPYGLGLNFGGYFHF